MMSVRLFLTDVLLITIETISKRAGEGNGRAEYTKCRPECS